MKGGEDMFERRKIEYATAAGRRMAKWILSKYTS